MMTNYEKDINKLKERILKDGDTLLSKRDLLERFCEVDEEYNGEPWNLLQILTNIHILIGEEPCEDAVSREDAIRELKQFSGTTRLRLSANFWEALNRAIKSLEQEPCEDAVSRQAVLDKAYAYGNGLEPEGYCVNVEDIQALPPVKPTQRWIPVTEDAPPIGTICLWCNKQGSVFTSEITYRSESSSYVGKHGYFSNGLENYGDIVAWMPLPKPYKGSEE